MVTAAAWVAAVAWVRSLVQDLPPEGPTKRKKGDHSLYFFQELGTSHQLTRFNTYSGVGALINSAEFITK